MKHNILLKDDIPFQQRHRRIPPALYQEVKDHLQQLLHAGVIRQSSSPYASAVVLVRKKNGKLRFCVDFRELNAKGVRDSYALPRIDELLDNLSGCRYFSTLDMQSGYHQLQMEEQDKPKTAFTAVPLGFYEFNVLPFGLCNAPSTFQRLVERCMGELNMKEVFAFFR